MLVLGGSRARLLFDGGRQLLVVNWATGGHLHISDFASQMGRLRTRQEEGPCESQ